MNVRTDIDRLPQSAKTLLAGIVDYAGLFPPSQIEMPAAVANYAAYIAGPYREMLGRFVVPAVRLDEFWESAAEYVLDGQEAWQLAVIAGDDLADTLRRVREFNAAHGTHAVCDVLEVKADSESKIENTVAGMPAGITAYFEIVSDARLPELVAALSLRGQFAKIRTGGITPEAFPSAREIVRFVRTCTAANVAFKATAGLHHPLKCLKPLTYEPDAVQGKMHGFLNVLMMTAFARESFRPSLLEELMDEESGDVFDFSDSGVTWRNDHRLSTTHLRLTRQRGMHSFGSCSFDEPIEDLKALGLL